MINLDGKDDVQRQKPIGFHVLKSNKVKVENSAAGNPCLIIEFDIEEGSYKGFFKKFPLRWMQVLNNPVGKRIVNDVKNCFVNSNEGLIDPALLNATEFDESVLNGLLIGAEINTRKGKNDKDFCNIKAFCTTAEAREKNGTF